MDVFCSIVVYAGLLIAAPGILSLAWPLRFLGIASRGTGAIVFGCGVAVALVGFLLPATESKVAAQQSRLDEFFPVYQFQEFHTIRVKAPRERVYAAIKEVRADEILFFRTLVWIRRRGGEGPESILNPSGDSPILDVALRTSFLKLAEEPGREIVLGTLVAVPRGWRPRGEPTPEAFRALREPGFAPAATNFRLEDAGANETRVITETRIFATDAATRRRFAVYWRVIYPGSALIRRMWLRAIKKRSEEALG
jgi:hypothetical protein